MYHHKENEEYILLVILKIMGDFLKKITGEILKYSDCAIWYNNNDNDYEDINSDLGQMNLFVIPITTRLLTKPCRAMQLDVPFALENHIPILPLMQEGGLDELFTRYFGDLQYLDPNTHDITAISYEEKLKKYLNSVIIGDELAEKVRAAFDAYIFLSYRKKDRKYANELMRLIHKNEFCRDIAIWYDEFLVPGEDFNNAITAALKKSELFTLVVTPNLIDEDNYVKKYEYPAATKQHKKVLPVEIVKTDHKELSKQYPEIPNCVDVQDEIALSKSFESALLNIAKKENDSDPEHNFFIGLAYLDGIDVEKNHERALILITSAAETNEVPEAIEKLVAMYKEGYGVKRDYRKAVEWQKKLVEYWEREYQSSMDIDEHRKLFFAYLDLGNIYISLYDIESARNTYKQVLILCEEFVNETETVETLTNLSITYEKLGDLWKEIGDPDLDIYDEFYLKSLDVRNKILEETKTVDAMINLANIYDKLGELYSNQMGLNNESDAIVFQEKLLITQNKAIESLKKSIDIKKSIIKETKNEETQLSLAQSYSTLAICYVQNSFKTFFTNFIKTKQNFIIAFIFSLSKVLKNMGKKKKFHLKSFKIVKNLAKVNNSISIRNALASRYSELSVLQMPFNIRGLKKYCEKAIAIREQLVTETESSEIMQDLINNYLQFLSTYYLMRCNYLKPLKFFRKSFFQKELNIFRKAFIIQEQLMNKEIKVKVFKNLVAMYIGFSGVTTFSDLYDRELLEKALMICSTLSEQSSDSENYTAQINQIKSLLRGESSEKALSYRLENIFDDMINTLGEEERRKLSVSHLKQGDTYKSQGDFDGAERLYKKSLFIREQLVKEIDTNKSKRDLSVVYERLAKLYIEYDNFEIAEEYYQKSLSLREHLMVETKNEKSKAKLIFVYEELGKLQKMRGNQLLAEEFYQKALIIKEELATENQTEELLISILNSYDILADICNQTKKLDETESFYLKAISLRESLLDKNNSVGLRLNLSANYGKLGDFYKNCCNLDKAEEFYKKCISLNELLLKNNDNFYSKQDLSTSLERLGDIYNIRKENINAEDFYRKSSILREQLVEMKNSVKTRTDLSVIYGKLARVCKLNNNLNDAVEFYKKNILLYERLADETKTTASYASLADTYYYLAIIQKPYDKTLLEKSLKINTSLAEENPNIKRYSQNIEAINRLIDLISRDN